MKADNDNHAEIYLQPPGTAEAPEGRLWCQDDAPFDCEDDDGNVVPWVKYVRSDIYDALAARLAEAEKDRSHLRGLIALCVTRAEAYGSAEFAKVLRSALRTAVSASGGA